jgi:hypothetical protein
MDMLASGLSSHQDEQYGIGYGMGRRVQRHHRLAILNFGLLFQGSQRLEVADGFAGLV